MTIIIRQIKAARALLDWTQKELARISGVSLATIAQIESGSGNPRAETMRVIQSSFEKYNIEFTDDPGVRVQREHFDVQIWQGRDAMLQCWSDMEQTMEGGGEILISCVDDELWKSLYPKEMLEMYGRRTSLGITTLGLLTDLKKNHSEWPSRNYRVVPVAATSANVPYYVYKNKVAIIKMIDPIRIVLINNVTVAESFRAQFQYHWDNGRLA